MTVLAPCSPIAAALRVPDPSVGTGVAATVTISVGRDEPVFAGHYPGFAIFPGVCVIEFAHRAALATAPAQARRLRLEEVETVRFRRPVYPGAELTAQVEWSVPGVRCLVHVHTDDGEAAMVRLRYSGEDR